MLVPFVGFVLFSADMFRLFLFVVFCRFGMLVPFVGFIMFFC